MSRNVTSKVEKSAEFVASSVTIYLGFHLFRPVTFYVLPRRFSHAYLLQYNRLLELNTRWLKICDLMGKQGAASERLAWASSSLSSNVLVV